MHKLVVELFSLFYYLEALLLYCVVHLKQLNGHGNIEYVHHYVGLV